MSQQYAPILRDFKGTYLPEKFAKCVKSIEEMKLKNSDIWVCTFPKSGISLNIFVVKPSQSPNVFQVRHGRKKWFGC